MGGTAKVWYGVEGTQGLFAGQQARHLVKRSSTNHTVMAACFLLRDEIRGIAVLWDEGGAGENKNGTTKTVPQVKNMYFGVLVFLRVRGKICNENKRILVCLFVCLAGRIFFICHGRGGFADCCS